MLTKFVRFAPSRSFRRLISHQNPHIEEEYFEDFEDSIPSIKQEEKQKTSEFRRQDDVDFIGNVVGALTEQKAKDLFVVRAEEKEMTPFSHKIICSVFNSRQAAAITENLKSLLKIEGAGGVSHVKRTTKRSNGWYVSEIDRVQIHVMSEECREKYDLEAIWAGDDRILDEIDAEKHQILLPPKRSSN